MKRDYQIDVLKLLGSFFVVAIHVIMNYRVQENEVAKTVILGECFVKCCVPIFFMCSGYVLFQKQHSIKKIYKKLFVHIVMPTLFVLLFLFVFYEKIENQNTWMGCLKTLNKESVGRFLTMILCWDVWSVGDGMHLWYMLEMIKIYIAFPVLALLCVNEAENSKIRRYVMGIMFIFAVLCPTIEYVSQSSIQIYKYSIFPQYCILYILIGYEFFLFFTQRQRSTKYLWIGIILYVLGSVLNYLSTMYLDIYADGVFDESFFNYDGLWILISALGFFMIWKNIEIKSTKLQSVVSFLGQRTFVLYLVHYPIRRIFSAYGAEAYLFQNLPRVLFYIIIIVSIYCLSMLLSLVFYGLEIGKERLGKYWRVQSLSEKK